MGTRRVMLVTDETGLPAAAAILGSLPRDAEGRALIELPSPEDRQDLDAPAGVEVTWLPREDPHEVPGRAALAAARELPVPAEPFFGWVVGEQALPVALRRHWVGAGVPKEHIMFCGYWRAGGAK
ncbi:siderophore-interacting protein [Planomonospora parontospora]|nr:siderophore-interacting protein [Planomonospora parontospora]